MEITAELRGEGAVELVYRLIDQSFTVTRALCRKMDPKIGTAPKTQSRSKDKY